ncbi:hypothetical protein S7335_3443 [Synechococcus sp. PCC 7335]|uniref:hypothetical protein n=1 Tax=Synechococcus sp. (strain ATCC 29403 / PCC 7335) TaxID=91464 RepID=UPI00017EB4E0|nr:hypothetical protein [Synechococcus sp. PCC 7335]EDX85740.1 hypothetical protein S7335_3443 [Synechococcus sp. PCC 7335]
METPLSAVKTSLLTGATLVAFAANSLLTRMALGEGAIDAASFSTIRLLSGATMLLAITALTHPKKPSLAKGNWTAAVMLFLYAIAFSFSYL